VNGIEASISLMLCHWLASQEPFSIK